MKNFITKYLIAIMAFGVMCTFTQDSKTITALAFMGFCSVVLCIVEIAVIFYISEDGR